MKKQYTEPVTNVTEVELEGFICVSLWKVQPYAEVDEYVNRGATVDETIEF